jgi:structural maintenance of chromosome 4
MARRVERNSHSTYYLNNQPTTYKEICHILRQKGIDLLHNRFLILQGEVEQISLMKPKGESHGETGLLEYLEDIIGSNPDPERAAHVDVSLSMIQD